MKIAISIILILIYSNILIYISRKVKTSSVVLLIIGGLIFGISPIKEIILDPAIEYLTILGDIGLISLMFIAGLESSWRELYEERKDAVIIALFSFFIPFIFGFLVMTVMGFSIATALVVGVCMSITAEATKARVLLELGKLKTKLGATMMGAGLVDDLLGLFSFILITIVFRTFELRENLLVAGSIIAFFAGVFIQKEIGRRHFSTKIIEKIIESALIPFFFISIGINFDLRSLVFNPLILIVVVLVAFIGKFLGSLVSKPFVRLQWSQIALMGWAMNSRGALEIGLAIIALRVGLIEVDLYSSLIVMALITTLIFPFIINYKVRKYPKIMDV